MKNKLISVLALFLVFTILILSGCNKDKAPEEETTTEVADVVETTAVTEEKETKASTTADVTLLTEEEIIELYIAANNMYDGWLCHGWTPELDRNDIVSINDSDHYAYVKSDDFKSVSALEKELKKYFSEEIYREYLDDYYIMHNDKMYGRMELGQGGDAPSSKFGLTIKSISEKECTFTVAFYYGGNDIATDYVDYKIKLINGNWIFVGKFIESSGLCLNNDIPWIITDTEEITLKEQKTEVETKFVEKEEATAKKKMTTEEIVELFNTSANKIKTDASKVVKNYEDRTVNRDKTKIPDAVKDLAEDMLGSLMKDDTEPIVYATREEIVENYLIPDQSYVSKLQAKDVVKATCKDTGDTYEIYFKLKDQTNPTAGVGVGSVCDVIEAHEIAEDAPFVDKFTTDYYNCIVKAVIDKETGKMVHTNYTTSLVLNITVSMFGKHEIAVGFTFEKDYDITY